MGFRGAGELGGAGGEDLREWVFVRQPAKTRRSRASELGLGWAARFRRWVSWVFKHTNRKSPVAEVAISMLFQRLPGSLGWRIKLQFEALSHAQLQRVTAVVSAQAVPVLASKVWNGVGWQAPGKAENLAGYHPRLEKGGGHSKKSLKSAVEADWMITRPQARWVWHAQSVQ
ncbi:hypothetical protein LY78DRAFT_109119 [Colletotrichum sublineola]|nr:hypothetical protein LY78DRAFT_109119 [Colletotrichum sublineola]